jgi:hypothetical protein
MKKLIFICFTLLFALTVASAQYNGTCGANLTWTLNDSTLTISGIGTMTNWQIPNYAPWYQYRSQIASVLIGDSVTSIGYYAFPNYGNLTSTTIGNSVTSIQSSAFINCALTSITSYASIPPQISSAFIGVPLNIPVYIPCATRLAYTSSNYWSSFTNFIESGATTFSYAEIICQGNSYSDVNFPNPLTVQGNYINYLTNIDGCDSIITLHLMFMQQQEICMVSVDSKNHNEVIWERNDNGGIVSSYNIYKEGNQSGNYDLVANIPYESENKWTDMESNAKIRSYRYKISVMDTCGNESPLSAEHRTMHLTLNQGQGNAWNLIWTAYEGVSYQTYNIYRSSGDSIGEMELIGTMPSGNTSFSDFGAPEGYVYYVVEIILDEACYVEQDDPSRSTTSASIRSNVATNNPAAAIKEVLTNNLSIYPNPAKDELKITNHELRNGEMITISDLQGRVVGNYELKITNYGEGSINISNLPNGVYVVKAGSKTAKIIKES